MPVPPYRPPNLRCFKNREMLVGAKPRPGDFRPVPDFDGGLVTVRYDDGSGRVRQMRPRFMNAEERRKFPEDIRRISDAHAEDLQALADM